MIDIRIDDWRGWAPGLETPAAWQAWAEAPHVVHDDGQLQPACAFLPAMQRRRLSRLARMTLETAWPLCGEHEQLPFVFASRHGETPRTLALLGDIADGQPLSPTRFGLSVHNAIAGQWSILRGQHGESTAIAGEADVFEHAVLEGALQLAAGAPAVLVVVAEELPPAAYAQWIDDVPFSYAVALRMGNVGQPDGDAAGNDASGRSRASGLGRASGSGWRLQQARNTTGGAPCAWPHALDFLRALLVRQSSLEHLWKARRWNWQQRT
ncbi:beta-ketoacyl synthase chain length factor [Dyella sp. A6]|uniref:beta-ketoacyl synthase chain length factor n=1 Tax=Dyella aluminiiresistens TaxID=3069105 RepID=UPI002E784674|nr:beta-ketoacyl synthase chain length factor [Dyella sp. A6]